MFDIEKIEKGLDGAVQLATSGAALAGTLKKYWGKVSKDRSKKVDPAEIEKIVNLIGKMVNNQTKTLRAVQGIVEIITVLNKSIAASRKIETDFANAGNLLADFDKQMVRVITTLLAVSTPEFSQKFRLKFAELSQQDKAESKFPAIVVKKPRRKTKKTTKSVRHEN